MAMAGLSDGFVYAPKPPAAPAANIRVSVPPYNKDEFKNSNDTIMFNIPSGKRGQYLNTRMSYLKFDLDVQMTVKTGQNPIVALDGGAHALIDAIEVYHGSNLLEQIREYNNLYQLMLDNGEIAGNARSVSEGCDSRMSSSDVSYEFYNHDPLRHGAVVSPVILGRRITPPRVHVQTDKFSYIESGHVNQPLTQVTDGAIKTYDTQAGDFSNSAASVADRGALENSACNASDGNAVYVNGTHTVTYTFCMPILSGVVGTLMPKYLPVGSLANDLRLELSIANFGRAFKTVASLVGQIGGTGYVSTSPSDILEAADGFEASHAFTIKGCELQLEYIEVASDVQQAIEAATGGQYVTSFDSFYHYETTLPTGSTGGTQLIGAKFSSIKTVMTTFRDQYGMNRPSYSSVTSRLNPFSTQSNRLGVGMGNPSLETRYKNGTGWQYQIGATQYPSKPVTSSEESWLECVKSQHAVAAQNRGGLCTRPSWNTSARADDTANMTPSKWYEFSKPGGSFFIAQNLESQSHKSHLAESGVNTLAQSMYLMTRMPGKEKVSSNLYVQEATDVALQGAGYDGSLTALTPTGGSAADNLKIKDWYQRNVSMQLDHYVHYDAILIISNGICSTRF